MDSIIAHRVSAASKGTALTTPRKHWRIWRAICVVTDHGSSGLDAVSLRRLAARHRAPFAVEWLFCVDDDAAGDVGQARAATCQQAADRATGGSAKRDEDKLFLRSRISLPPHDLPEGQRSGA